MLISLQSGEIKGWKNKEWTDTFTVDKLISDVDPAEYDGLLLPGGTLNSDKLRADALMVDFVKSFISEGKPVAAICHAPWLLVQADVVRGRKVTSFPSVQTDLRNAGADWSDQDVVVDNGLVTSRNPDDIPAFIEKMIEEFSEGIHTPHHS